MSNNAKTGEVVNGAMDIQRVAGEGITYDASLDVQIVTAKRFPRSIGDFKAKAKSMVVIDKETAEQCTYAIPRAGKMITGPSVRLAEICASAWGNLRAGAEVVGEDGKYVHAKAFAWDLETNVAIQRTIRRKVTRSDGSRYSDDMIAVTANAASSIAKREAIFDVVPRVYVREIQKEAHRLIAGDVKALPERRKQMVKYFMDMGIKEERIFSVVGRKRIEDINLDDIVTLHGIATAIKDGDISAKEAFPAVDKERDPNKSAAEQLVDDLKEKPEPEKPSAKKQKDIKEKDNEYRQKAHAMLEEMYGGDEEEIKKAYAKYTGKDENLDKVTISFELRAIVMKIERDYTEWLKGDEKDHDKAGLPFDK